MALVPKKDTKSLLVSVAIDLFKEKGVDAVSIKDICASAKVTRNAYYYYFQSKEMIYDAIGDYLTEISREKSEALLKEKSHYRKIWEIYRPFLEFQLEMGPDIMNHCNQARSLKGHADNYMYVDEKMQNVLESLINLAKEDGEVQTTAETQALAEASYAIVRGNNLKWCYRWGESDLLADVKKSLDTLFLPVPSVRLHS